MRWPLSRRFQRLQVRWRAFRMRPGEEWKPPDSSLKMVGYLTEPQRAAIAEACRLLDAEPVGATSRSEQRKTIGTQIRGRDGSPSWLKLAQFASRELSWYRGGELAARRLASLPMPEILHDFEFTSCEVHWHAIQFSLAPSPTLSDRSWISSPLRTIEDEWLNELKRAIETVNQIPLTRWLVHPGRVARTIVQRFGRRAPYIIDEWRTAHGDLNWGNVTAPKLTLLDWEFWGAAPRGFDAATLLSHTFMDEELFRRIEASFAEDLNTPSGVVARLFRFAQVLDDVEAGIRDPREQRIAEAEGRRLLRL